MLTFGVILDLRHSQKLFDKTCSDFRAKRCIQCIDPVRTCTNLCTLRYIPISGQPHLRTFYQGRIKSEHLLSGIRLNINQSIVLNIDKEQNLVLLFFLWSYIVMEGPGLWLLFVPGKMNKKCIKSWYFLLFQVVWWCSDKIFVIS